MAATSKHPGDIYLWIINVIESCENLAQLDVADKLIFNFASKAEKIDDDFLSNLVRALKTKSLIKSHELVSKTV